MLDNLQLLDWSQWDQENLQVMLGYLLSTEFFFVLEDFRLGNSLKVVDGGWPSPMVLFFEWVVGGHLPLLFEWKVGWMVDGHLPLLFE